MIRTNLELTIVHVFSSEVCHFQGNTLISTLDWLETVARKTIGRDVLGERWGLHWFRRDLRIAGNRALRKNWETHKGCTLGIFCFDSAFLARADFSHNRFAFFLKTLQALREDLREQGGDLLVVDCLPRDAFPQLFAHLAKNKMAKPSMVSWSRDYEPYAIARDEEVELQLKNAGVSTYHCRDHLLFEPNEILKSEKPGHFYQIYSPFAKKWFAALSSAEGQSRIKSQDKAQIYFQRARRTNNLFRMQWKELQKNGDLPFSDAFDRFVSANSRHVSIAIPEAGFFKAYGSLLEFKEKLGAYKKDRDIPSLDGTSRLSMFLKNGSLTVPQIIAALNLKDENWNIESGKSRFLKELVWREFYYSILFHRPDVEKQSFLPQFRDLKWENNEAHFQRWKEGMTGFPIVDAGMRELIQTGWMHNRVRMIVASFLTKDLLIDWRWGENHFMKELLDGDLAPNNGGWQWAASTGCDPQPYFRVFNPWLQGKKFDPDCTYIKKFVPELANAPSDVIHDPDGDRSQWRYPAPLVNHSVQRNKALKLYGEN